MTNYQEKYEALLKEFEQYKRESIKWGVEDFTYYDHPRYTISDDQALPTDDELFKQAILAMEEMYGSGCDSEIDAYFRGAKWMQKQFKGGDNAS